MQWSRALGGGYSGPAVADGRLFVLDWVGDPVESNNAKYLHDGVPPENTNFVRKLLPGTERVVCLSEADGKILWTHQYDCPYTIVATYANGPRVTRAIDNGHVYTLGTEGQLFCLRVADGSVVFLWQPRWNESLLPQVFLSIEEQLNHSLQELIGATTGEIVLHQFLREQATDVP